MKLHTQYTCKAGNTLTFTQDALNDAPDVIVKVVTQREGIFAECPCVWCTRVEDVDGEKTGYCELKLGKITE